MQKMNIKLLVTDIDDTLIGHDLRLSQRNADAIKAARDQGVIVAIATGRMHDSAMPYVDRLDLHGPVLSYQGAVIIDSLTGETIRYCPLTLDLAKEALSFAAEHGVYAQYYTIGEYHMAQHCDESELYARLAGIRGIPVGGPLIDKLTFDPVKVLMVADDDTIATLFPLAQEKFGDRMEVARSKDFYLEFTHSKGNKGEAVKILAKRYNIPIDQVMTIGDGHNDISMLRTAGWGVAMGNADDEVKQAADAVTVAQDADGAAKAIERYVLGK